MHKPTSPFTREQLLPKEETLELTKEKAPCLLGFLKRPLFKKKEYA